jgi:hypothetical protein
MSTPEEEDAASGTNLGTEPGAGDAEVQSSSARVNDQIKVVGEEGRGRKGTRTHMAMALEEDRGK